AGHPAGTENVVRQIEDRLFKDVPAGLPGNDDLGATSSWYVWAALGAYPETPGSAAVALGSPLFPSVTVTLADGRTITENAPAASGKDRYVVGLTVDGTAWQSAYLPATVFTDGADLGWSLGSSPTGWAGAPQDAPPSSTTGLLPALGYLAGANGGDVVVSPGQAATLTLGVQSMSEANETVAWRASVPSDSGIVATPDSGALTVPGEAKATESVALRVPAGLADGQYPVTFTATASGSTLPAVVAVVDVT
ncbi:MAG TPA: glycoside hydrolase domain-containing protein, partial [Acidimicrobiales bacterium]|nr:glycoside hydrolase domain-containing protein [Acidimicrobiales bacterium]